MNNQNTPANSTCCGGACETNVATGTARPEYQVENSEEGVTVRIALPGATKDLTEISVQDRVLSVRAERKDEVPAEWTRLRESPRPAAYELQVRLHADLDPSSVRAELNEGVLSLAISRDEAAKPRAIEVK